MMSQNVPNLAFQKRLPIIVQGLREGLTYEEIGKRCTPPVTRRQIYRDRKSVEFRMLFNELLDECLADLAKLKAMGDGKDKRFALSQKLKLVMSMMRSVYATKIEADITGEPTDIRLTLHPSLISVNQEETQ
jgi:hypothetical protein